SMVLIPCFHSYGKIRQLVCAVVYRKRFPHFKLKAGKHEPAFNHLSINQPQFYNETNQPL
ncbi:MAG: hypothetical protein KKD27_19615, partial [Gammaproteobacteria bacterium]|nr:hypothetical protein [Gammaproteobacteria bacterium]MBU2373921.1 hypothetical protein [Gammaproteobacteria bacterium]